jgi:hypothetical protein
VYLLFFILKLLFRRLRATELLNYEWSDLLGAGQFEIAVRRSTEASCTVPVCHPGWRYSAWAASIVIMTARPSRYLVMREIIREKLTPGN